MSIQIIRQVVGGEKQHVVAGYSDITWGTAIRFLDYIVDDYRKKDRYNLTSRPNNYMIEDRSHEERILSDKDGRDVLRFFLRIKNE
jgi:hypothetical protein